MRTCVLGCGSFGTALAAVLTWNGQEVLLWGRDVRTLEEIQNQHKNPNYLPFLALPPTLRATPDLARALADAELVICALPSTSIRQVLSQVSAHFPSDAALLMAAKGIEPRTLFTMSELAEDVLPPSLHRNVAVLSGPSFAEELARRMPTAVTVAAHDESVALRCQEALQSEDFRLYTSQDMMGVQLGGALKNVIAIAAGISDGLGFGDNARAAIITRGLAEITRLAVRRGANPVTLAGLSGVGDLVLTCTGQLSRNRRVGIELGKGRTLAEALQSVRTVAEGVNTALSAESLAEKFGIELPISHQVYCIAHQGQDPRKAVVELMGRRPKPEA